jgi:hypothetical protein
LKFSGWLVGWLVGWLKGWLAAQLVSWLGGWLGRCLINCFFVSSYRHSGKWFKKQRKWKYGHCETLLLKFQKNEISEQNYTLNSKRF